MCLVFFFQAEDGIRDGHVTGVQTCALPISELFEELGLTPQLSSVGSGSAGIDDEIAVMTAQDAKGLEFDAVVIVEPAELIDSHGAGDLYVAMTRPTTHLGLVHARPLPAGIAG